MLAFCRISATFTGVPPRRSARITDGDRIVDAFVDADGQAWLRDAAVTAAGALTRLRVPHRSWADACADLAERTGVRVV